jgi:hypothetical protein
MKLKSINPECGLPPIKSTRRSDHFEAKTVKQNVPILRGWEKSRPLCVYG